MNDCCIMVHHEIRSIEQSRPTPGPGLSSETDVGSAQSKPNMATSSGRKEDDTMEVESHTSHGEAHESNGEGSSEERRNNSRMSLKQVTDDSCESEDTERGKDCCSGESRNVRQPQHQVNQQQSSNSDGQQEGHPSGSGKEACKKQDSGLKRAGPVMEDDQQSSSNTEPPTLPQHQRIQYVEPQDINYRSTPASLKLREVLLSRLHLIAPSGRIQVVSYSSIEILRGAHNMLFHPVSVCSRISVCFCFRVVCWALCTITCKPL